MGEGRVDFVYQIFLHILIIHVLLCVPQVKTKTHYHDFFVKSSPYTRLCKSKHILTVNGEFPGPTLRVHRGDSVVVKAHNEARHNITLHWHGLKQPRNPWSDGPEYITQCPLRPGQTFTYNLNFTDEEGTIWWHAHNGWARATVHGAIVVLPKRSGRRLRYPFPTPHADFPLILGEWWKRDVMGIPGNEKVTGGEPTTSDAYTINGRPGHLYQCEEEGMVRIMVERGRRYLLRIINAVMDEDMFLAIADHKMIVVGTDGSYTKPFITNHLMITPGQTMDVLVETNQPPDVVYLVASRAYNDAVGSGFDHSTTTAVVEYYGSGGGDNLSRTPLPQLPAMNDTPAASAFTRRLRSLVDNAHRIYHLPMHIDERLFYTLSVNLLNCTVAKKHCKGPFGRRFSASVNNVSFVTPTKIDLLKAYYGHINGVFESNFPDNPPTKFDYTGENLPQNLLSSEYGTRVKVLEYNTSVELVLQGTNVLASDNHPIHFHGTSFFTVGWGFGNFDDKKDPIGFNLVDPPEQNTVGVPNNGWVAIRFIADNPGVWLMHCHLDRHQNWGMSMVLIVKNGKTPETSILPPPKDLPSFSILQSSNTYDCVDDSSRF